MGFGVLFLLLLVTAGWWLHSRWSALRDAQAARREAEMMFIMEARLNAAGKVARSRPHRPRRATSTRPCPASEARAPAGAIVDAHDSGRVMRSGVRHVGT